MIAVHGVLMAVEVDRAEVRRRSAVVAIPPHLVPAVAEHLLQHACRGPRRLVCTALDGQPQLTPDMLKRPFGRARQDAPARRTQFHDLRGTGAVLAVQSELMVRLGHSTPGAALRYQDAAARGRDARIAAALSRITDGQP